MDRRWDLAITDGRVRVVAVEALLAVAPEFRPSCMRTAGARCPKASTPELPEAASTQAAAMVVLRRTFRLILVLVGGVDRLEVVFVSSIALLLLLVAALSSFGACQKLLCCFR